MDDPVVTGSAVSGLHGASSSVREQEGNPPRSRSRVLSFFVPGRPVPKGSKTIMRGRLVETTRGLGEWSNVVSQTAAIERIKLSPGRRPMYEGAVTVLLDFALPRPQRPKASEHITKPDVDKLARTVLDALTSAAVWVDDAQVDKLILHKHYANPTMGVTIVVTGSTS